LALLPTPEEMGPPVDAEVSAAWDRLLKLRRTVLIDLEAARNAKSIGGGLEAKVLLNSTNADADLWLKYKNQLPSLFIVSQVEILSAAEANQPENQHVPGRNQDVCLGIKRADGKKCERCWNYSTHVGESADYPTVCERCVKALTEIERAAMSGGSSGSAKS
jgi:isoleucyl-tRNA synthetase